MSKSVLVGMSGGVDSSASAILLKDQGYDVTGCTMILDENNMDKAEQNIKDAKSVCDKLGIKHVALDLRDTFNEKVISNFVSEYEKGNTPNPCIECNKYLKFGAMIKEADRLGIEYIATGHYAKIEYNEEYKEYVLKKSSSTKKDQSYVLYNIDKKALSRILFPLASYETKEEIRKIVKESGLDIISSKKDSLDICFIPDGDYVSFLIKKGLKEKKGNIVDKKGITLGIHNGIIHYTVGQRKGIGISTLNKTYVVGIDEKNNNVIVGEEKDIYSTIVNVKDVNYLADCIKDEEIKITAKVRYAAKEASATLYRDFSNITIAKVIFDAPQRAVTKGQSIVFYRGDVVLGGGKIC